MGFLESCHPAGRGVEQNPVAGLRRLDPDADREVGFPGPGWAEEDHILAFGEEHAGAEVGDQIPVGRRLVVEVEVLKRLVSGEPGRFDPQAGAGGFPFGDLFRQDRSKVFLMRPASVAGLVTEATERITDAGCAQGAGVVLDLRRRFTRRRPGHDATASTVGTATSDGRAVSRSSAGSTPNSSS